MAIVQIQLRRDNTQNWTLNPILASGEPAYDTDLKTLKIGDGSSNYLTLPALDFHLHEQSLDTTDSVTFANVSSSYMDFDELGNGYGTPPPHKPGRVWYDHEEGALSVYNFVDGPTMNLGQEQWMRAINSTGAEILDGTPVFISGSQGDNPYMHPAYALQHHHHTKPVHIVGVVTHDVPNNSIGFITTSGRVNGVDTSLFDAGRLLYLSSSAGEYTQDRPEFPYEAIQVGGVLRSHANDGIIFVRTKEPIHFNDISGLSGSDETNNEIWVYRDNPGVWTNAKDDLHLTGSYTFTEDVPTTTTDSGSKGEIRVDNERIYVCIADNTWKRSAILASW